MLTFHELRATDIAGKEVDFSRYKGKVCLVVNLASLCGYTPQYKGLQSLYDRHKNKGFEILGFPCNQFGKEEPGTDEEIKSFCSTKYHVTFDLFSKIDVKGKYQSPVYAFLTGPANSRGSHEVDWNFQKYLIGPDGAIVGTYDPKVEPGDGRFQNDLKKVLAGS